MVNETMECSRVNWGQDELVRLSGLAQSALHEAAAESERLRQEYEAAVQRDPTADPPPPPRLVRQHFLTKALPPDYAPGGTLSIYYEDDDGLSPPWYPKGY